MRLATADPAGITLARRNVQSPFPRYAPTPPSPLAPRSFSWYPNPHSRSEMTLAVVTLLAFLVLLFALWVLVRLLKKFWAGFRGTWWTVFGDTLQARVVGLGVAVFVFPGMVAGPLNSLSRLLQISFAPAESEVLSLTNDVAILQKSGQLSLSFILPVIHDLGKIAASAISAASFPITPVIYGFACWVLVGATTQRRIGADQRPVGASHQKGFPGRIEERSFG
jgi:hypothetical protein